MVRPNMEEEQDRESYFFLALTRRLGKWFRVMPQKSREDQSALHWADGGGVQNPGVPAG
jgi:hypothetical protein